PIADRSRRSLNGNRTAGRTAAETSIELDDAFGAARVALIGEAALLHEVALCPGPERHHAVVEIVNGSVAGPKPQVGDAGADRRALETPLEVREGVRRLSDAGITANIPRHARARSVVIGWRLAGLEHPIGDVPLTPGLRLAHCELL